MLRFSTSSLYRAPYIVGGRLGPLAARRFPWLYLVTDPRTAERFPHQDDFLNHVEKAIVGGVDIVQFRDKKQTDEEYLATARALQQITAKYDIPLVINDRVEIARKLLTDSSPSPRTGMGEVWLHVGRKDWPVGSIGKLRKKLDPNEAEENDSADSAQQPPKRRRPLILPSQRRLSGAVVGFSVDSGNLEDDSVYEEASSDATVEGVDYFGVGPIFATKTKSDAAEPMGLVGLRKAVHRASGTPIIAIGGITSENVQSVMACGIAGVAVIGEIMDAQDPTKAAELLKKKMKVTSVKYRERDPTFRPITRMG